jgi:hypothetical protein
LRDERFYRERERDTREIEIDERFYIERERDTREIEIARH